jgi:hypothetical protein
MSDTIPQNIPTKQCTQCQSVFPATLEFFSKDSNRKGGLNCYCKLCTRANWKARNPRKTKEELSKGFKRCHKCSELYPATDEYFSTGPQGMQSPCKKCKTGYEKAHKDEISERKRQYYLLHKEVIDARNKQYHKDHPERMREANGRYKEAHPEKYNARFRVYYQRHQDIIRAKARERYEIHKDRAHERYRQYHALNKAKANERNRRYQKIHKERISESRKRRYILERERIAAYYHKRRAYKAQAPGTLTPAQIREKLRAQHYRCYYAACGYAKFEKRDGKHIFHIEHTIPISRTEAGPRHDVNYVVLACPFCNQSKNNRLPHEWPEGGRLF